MMSDVSTPLNYYAAYKEVGFNPNSWKYDQSFISQVTWFFHKLI